MGLRLITRGTRSRGSVSTRHAGSVKTVIDDGEFSLTSPCVLIQGYFILGRIQIQKSEIASVLVYIKLLFNIHNRDHFGL